MTPEHPLPLRSMTNNSRDYRRASALRGRARPSARKRSGLLASPVRATAAAHRWTESSARMQSFPRRQARSGRSSGARPSLAGTAGFPGQGHGGRHVSRQTASDAFHRAPAAPMRAREYTCTHCRGAQDLLSGARDVAARGEKKLTDPALKKYGQCRIQAAEHGVSAVPADIDADAAGTMPQIRAQRQDCSRRLASSPAELQATRQIPLSASATGATQSTRAAQSSPGNDSATSRAEPASRLS